MEAPIRYRSKRVGDKILEVPNFSVDWPIISASNPDKVAEDLPKTLKKVRKLMGRLHG
jgi:hypothetical protein